MSRSYVGLNTDIPFASNTNKVFMSVIVPVFGSEH